MKLTMLLCVVALMQVNAGTYAQKISLNVRDASLEQVLNIISKQSGLNFIYSSTALKEATPVSLSVKDQPLANVLELCLKDQPLTYVLNGNTVVIKKKAVTPLFSEKVPDVVVLPPITITGKVVDASGAPIAHASVIVKGTSVGVSTDDQGEFKINVPDRKAILIISSIGFLQQEIAVGNKDHMQVEMKKAEDKMDDIVVVGYGTKKVSDLTGAVTNIKADQTNTGGASASVDQMLQGRVAGVQFKQNTTQPGGGGTTIIRGRNSLFLNSDPLYVIDGFIVNSPSTPGTGTTQFSSPDKDPLNSINPADIESIAVLKDAAATAIYGAKGSNGVIIITTKKGKKGAAKITFDSYFSIQKIAKKFDVLNAPDCMNYWNKYQSQTSGAALFTPTQIANAKTTDWFDMVTRTGKIQNYNLSIAGASDNLNYYFSLGYFDNQGIVKNSGMQRLNGRGNLQYKKDKFSFGSNIFATNIVNNNQQTIGGTRSSVIASAITFAPYLPVRDTAGVYTRDVNNNFLVNPVSMLDINDKLTTDKLNFSVNADYEILKGLKPEIRMTYDIQDDNRNFFVPSTTPYNGSLAHRGTGSQSSQRALGYTINGLLHYDATFAEKHKVIALLGYEYYYRNNNTFTAFNSGFGTDITGANNLGGGTGPTVSSYKYDRKDISAFGRVDYTYNDKYLATITLRRDGSSVFGENNKFAVFPGISVGWKLDKEKFLSGQKNLDVLKLRAGYGVTGNSGITPYQSLSKYSMGLNTLDPNAAAIIGGNLVPAASLMDFKANPDLKWESTSQTNIGVDYGFFKRITGSLDFFVKNTKDMLVQVNINTSSGYRYQWQNAATMRTWGFEYSINSINVQHKNFQWRTNFNFSWLGNKITAYNTADPSTIASLNSMGIIKGERTNSYFTYIYDGINPSTGSFKFRDNNHDGTVNLADRQVYGSPDSKFIAGIGNTLSYKGVTLNFFFNGNFGNKLFNQTMAQYTVPYANNISNVLTAGQNYWSTTNTNSDIPANSGNGGGSWIYNSRWIEEAWFVRLQNVTLSYNIPAKALNNVFNNIRVYAQAQNLFIITPYKGMDPEAANNVYIPISQNMPAFLPGSADMNAYPPSRTFTFGLNLGF